MKKYFTLIELMVVVAILAIFMICLTPIGYFGYSSWKEAQMYEQFQTKYEAPLAKGDFVNILDRHPDGAFPVNPEEKQVAEQMSRELRMVVDGIKTVDETTYLKVWLEEKNAKD